MVIVHSFLYVYQRLTYFLFEHEIITLPHLKHTPVFHIEFTGCLFRSVLNQNCAEMGQHPKTSNFPMIQMGISIVMGLPPMMVYFI